MTSKGDKRAPAHELIWVKRQVKDNFYKINENALDGAYEAFGWSPLDIEHTILDLKPEGFQNSGPGYIQGATVDSYTGIGKNGEEFYLHFYIHPENGCVIINSCKQNEKVKKKGVIREVLRMRR